MVDSPSRQLVHDLAQDLEKVHLHTRQLKRVKAYQRTSFYEHLDRVDQQCQAEHYAALDRAALRHDQVREEAESALRDHIRLEEEKWEAEVSRLEHERIEREKAAIRRRERENARRKAQEEAERIEREKKEKAELEEKARQERERLAKEAEEEETQRRLDEMKKKMKQQAEEEEKRRKAEKAVKAEEAATAAEAEVVKKADQEQQEKAQEQQKQQQGAKHRGQTDEEARVHDRYRQLHQQLKKFRAYLVDQAKTNKILKQTMGDARRAITKCVGQIREGPGANRGQASPRQLLIFFFFFFFFFCKLLT